MKIIFDRKKCALWAQPNDPNNTDTKLIERRETQLKMLGEFMGASSVEYIDEDKGEQYIVTKGKNQLILDISGNHYDGGWMTCTTSRSSEQKQGIVEEAVNKCKLDMDNFIPI